MAGLLGAGMMSLFLLTGCGGAGGGDDSTPAGELLPGTWRATRLETTGQSTSCPGEITFAEDGESSVSCGSNDTITFFENGAFTSASAEDGAVAGTWQLSGNTLTIVITDPIDSVGTQSERLEFSGDDTFIADTEYGKITFTRR